MATLRPLRVPAETDAVLALLRHPPWISLGLLGAGALVGALLIRVPILRVLGASAGVLQTGAGVAAALAALRRATSHGTWRPADARRGSHLRNRLRRAA